MCGESWSWGLSGGCSCLVSRRHCTGLDVWPSLILIFPQKSESEREISSTCHETVMSWGNPRLSPSSKMPEEY